MPTACLNLIIYKVVILSRQIKKAVKDNLYVISYYAMQRILNKRIFFNFVIFILLILTIFIFKTSDFWSDFELDTSTFTEIVKNPKRKLRNLAIMWNMESGKRLVAFKNLIGNTLPLPDIGSQSLCSK